MNISFHPYYKKQAKNLKKFLKNNNIKEDINYIIGGDGTFLIYASKTQPNFLISPNSSVGYYASTRLGNHNDAIIKYLKNPEIYNLEYPTIESKINGIKLNDFAINEILITEGLQYLSKTLMTKCGVESYENNSGIIIYTHEGWNGFAKQLNARNYKNQDFGITSVAPTKGKLLQFYSRPLNNEVKFKILPRNRKTKFYIYVDCKNVKPYKHFCTNIKKVYKKPYKIKQNDEIIIKKGKPIIIASKI
jgi:hypothetical protein